MSETQTPFPRDAEGIIKMQPRLRRGRRTGDWETVGACGMRAHAIVACDTDGRRIVYAHTVEGDPSPPLVEVARGPVSPKEARQWLTSAWPQVEACVCDGGPNPAARLQPERGFARRKKVESEDELLAQARELQSQVDAINAILAGRR